MIFDFALARGDFNSATEERDLVDVRAEIALPNTRLVALRENGDVAVDPSGDGYSLWRPGEWLRQMAAERGWQLWFLGRDVHGHATIGVLVGDIEPFARALAAHGEPVPTWLPLFDFGPSLIDTEESLLATQATALYAWRNGGRFCPACGGPLALGGAGWTNACPACSHVEYPRTDPAVIVAVLDRSSRLLLVHNTLWSDKRMSLPAGYVDAGESAERTVRREMMEEVSLRVTDLRYLGSQPWPRPRSLMLAYQARTPDARPVPDGSEIDRAHFFEPQELRSAVLAGDVHLPGPAAIAHSIINTWLDGGLT